MSTAVRRSSKVSTFANSATGMPSARKAVFSTNRSWEISSARVDGWMVWPWPSSRRAASAGTPSHS